MCIRTYVRISPELCVHAYTCICTCGRRLLLCLHGTCTVPIVQYGCTLYVYGVCMCIKNLYKMKRKEEGGRGKDGQGERGRGTVGKGGISRWDE